MNGLTYEEVKINEKKYGKNIIDGKKNNSFLKLFIESLSDPIIKILLIALGIKIFILFKSFDWYETIGILIAIFLASFISTISEYGSNKAFESLAKENQNILCKVLRSGKIIEIFEKDVVVNDIIILSSGDRVPADGVIVKGMLSVNESFLTGESKEVIKNEDSEVYKMSSVFEGNAYVKIKSVGINTKVGKISNLLNTKNDDSPLKQKLTILAKQISKLGYLGAFLASFSYLFMEIVVKNNFEIDKVMLIIRNVPLMIEYLIYCLTLCVTIIIMAVPEGLPMMITLVLSSNMKKMMKDNVLVRKLSGIEASGSMNTLFCDKTGTLTEGKLSVNFLVDINGNKIDNYNEKILNCLCLNNECSYEGGKLLGGNSTDRAIKLFLKDKKVNKSFEFIKRFSSKLKYSQIKCDNIYYTKGAPEILFKNNTKISKLVDSYSKEGYRVLGCGYSFSKNIDNINFLCLIILSDKLRDSTFKTIKDMKKAGINVVMITGDNLDTALCVAKKAGIYEKEDLYITHSELDFLSDKELSEKIPKLKIIARALPEDKARLVKVYKKSGLVVGMTGDGVNDAVALKNADVGFSLGSACDVAKESSDIVILDDNISSIYKACLYGRTTFKSIRKFTLYQLTVNVCALFLSIIGVLFDISNPITIIQMLWLNMIMDTFAGLAFSYLIPRSKYMLEKPINKNEKVINSYMKNQIIINGFFSFLICLMIMKLNVISNLFENNYHLYTGFFATFIFLGIINSFLSRTSENNFLKQIDLIFLFINVFIIIVQIIIIYYGGSLFRTYGLSFKELIVCIILSFLIIPIDYIRKIILKYKKTPIGV